MNLRTAPHPAPVTGAIVIAGFGFSAAINWPGYLSYDSVIQILERMGGVCANWHPPVLSGLLGLGNARLPGAQLRALQACGLIGPLAREPAHALSRLHRTGAGTGAADADRWGAALFSPVQRHARHLARPCGGHQRGVLHTAIGGFARRPSDDRRDRARAAATRRRPADIALAGLLATALAFATSVFAISMRWIWRLLSAPSAWRWTLRSPLVYGEHASP